MINFLTIVSTILGIIVSLFGFKAIVLPTKMTLLEVLSGTKNFFISKFAFIIIRCFLLLEYIPTSFILFYKLLLIKIYWTCHYHILYAFRCF